MNVVRICFQASYRDQQGQMRRMDPVLSEPVYDKSESGVCVLGLLLATDTGKPHIRWLEQTSQGCSLFLFVSLLSLFVLIRLLGNIRALVQLCDALGHELAATAPDIMSGFKARRAGSPCTVCRLYTAQLQWSAFIR